MAVVAAVFVVLGVAVLAINSTGYMNASSQPRSAEVGSYSWSADDLPSDALTESDAAHEAPALEPVSSARDVGEAELTGAAEDCALFCDSSGYEPEWAKSMGENQASSKCLGINSPGSIGSADWSWCTEYNGYLLDAMMAP